MFHLIPPLFLKEIGVSFFKEICLKKIRYIIIIGMFIALFGLLFRQFLFYQPILNHIEKEFEREWRCQVTRKKGDINLLKGSFTFKDVYMTTPEKGTSKWELHADEIFIKIDYRSLLSEAVVVDEVIIDTVYFRQEKKKSLDRKNKDVSSKISRKQVKNTHFQKKKSRAHDARIRILIRYLLIRNGYFELYSYTKSGKKEKLHIKDITLRRKEIFLGRRLDIFFRALTKGLARSSE